MQVLWTALPFSNAFLLVRTEAQLCYPAAPSPMTWIKTVPLSEASEKLLRALDSQRSLYPKEYATPVFSSDDGVAGIVGSHSLIPEALLHAFSTFGVLMSPELPLSRQQQEMITTVVSVTNRCFY